MQYVWTFGGALGCMQCPEHLCYQLVLLYDTILLRVPVRHQARLKFFNAAIRAWLNVKNKVRLMCEDTGTFVFAPRVLWILIVSDGFPTRAWGYI